MTAPTRDDPCQPSPTDPTLQTPGPGLNENVRRYSKVYVEAELLLGQEFEFLVARSAKVDHFLVGLARSPFEKRYRVRADGITELPAVAVDNLTDFVLRQCRAMSVW